MVLKIKHLNVNVDPDFCRDFNKQLPLFLNRHHMPFNWNDFINPKA